MVCRPHLFSCLCNPRCPQHPHLFLLSLYQCSAVKLEIQGSSLHVGQHPDECHSILGFDTTQSQDHVNVLEQRAPSILCVAEFRATRLWNHIQDGGRTFLWNTAVRRTVITLSLWMYKCKRTVTKTSTKYSISCHIKPIFPSDKCPPESYCASTVEGQIVIKLTKIPC